MTLRLLLLEDSPADAELTAAHLVRTGLDVIARRVDSEAAFRQALTDFVPHVVLSDRGVPDFTALDALRHLKQLHPAVPFIVLTGAPAIRSAGDLFKAGADELLVKDDLASLRAAIDRALALRSGLHRLSPRQLEVLRLAAQGLTTPEVAERLGVSVKTAETHRTAMMRRLDLHDVAGLVRYAVRVRLIPNA
ncbi:MAG TPA: response regulator transcription factor [Longimicrobiales bacterium]|nr:response regulator transcription factor [Longimicrobiales bacterium]